jgi:hypothetical protein
MIKNLYWYIILALLAFYFFNNYQNVNYVEGYRNTKVYIGNVPMVSEPNFMENDTNFGSHSIFETGQIIRPRLNI